MSSARSKGRASREAIVIWSFGAVPLCDLVNVRGVEGGVNVVDRDERHEGETNGYAGATVPQTDLIARMLTHTLPLDQFADAVQLVRDR